MRYLLLFSYFFDLNIHAQQRRTERERKVVMVGAGVGVAWGWRERQRKGFNEASYCLQVLGSVLYWLYYISQAHVY